MHGIEKNCVSGCNQHAYIRFSGLNCIIISYNFMMIIAFINSHWKWYLAVKSLNRGLLFNPPFKYIIWPLIYVLCVYNTSTPYLKCRQYDKLTNMLY